MRKATIPKPVKVHEPDKYQRKQPIPEIPQAWLRDLVELRRQRREIEHLERELRDDIVGLLNAGAATEPGRYRPRVRSTKRAQLNWKSLAALLGEEACAQLRRALPVTTVTSLFVTDRAAPRRRRDLGDR
jgi:hypothetical protein